MTDFAELLRILKRENVDFVVIGGIAAAAHGSARSTLDLDVVYSRASQNLRRLASALAPLDASLRDAPPGLPFHPDESTLRAGLNFTLQTRLGELDLFGEIPGGEGYDALLPHTVEFELYGATYRFLDLETLIRVKRAAGRQRDLEAVAELQALMEEQQSDSRD